MPSAAALHHFWFWTLICFTLASCAENFPYSCVDSNWTKSCKIGIGDTYIGWNHVKSKSGKSCMEGTICEYDYAEMSIWCKISSTFAPYYEECEIPLCSDLPLCDSRLETFNGVLVDSTEGVALVSTTDQFMTAVRDRTVTEVELLNDITISEDDFSDIPIIFHPGRNAVINRPGQAKIICRLTSKESLPAFLVFSGANVTIHRISFIGNLIDGSFFRWEKLGHVTIIDSKFYIQPCSVLAAYIRGMFRFQLDRFQTKTTANEEDSALEFVIRESGVLPGGGGHAGVLLYDPERKLGGTQRYINTTVQCEPNELPPAPPIPPITLFLQPAAGREDETLPSTKTRNSNNNHTVLVAVLGVVAALVVVVGALGAYMSYRQPRQHASASLSSETVRTEIVICEPAEVDMEAYSDWITRMADRVDHKTVPSSAKLCEEIASVVASVTLMTSENSTSRIRKAQEFRTIAKSATVDVVSGHSPCPSSPFANIEGSTDESSTSALKNIPVASSSIYSAIAELQSGRVVHGYEYVRHLGSGTHGEVLLVCELNTKLHYTMKVPKDTNVQLVVQEAYFLAMLDHPNIVKHVETFVHNGQLIVVTEYCSLGDLQQCVERVSVTFPEEFVRSVLLQMAFAVSHMHMNVLAHRDIKPSNIFISESGIVKLGDLGSGRVIVHTSETFAGTPMFMAPQIIAGEAYTKECDVYSLGSVIYYLCSGKVAHSEAKSMDELKELQLRGPNLSLIRDGYSEQLTNAIARMMSPSEVLRPAALDVFNWEWLRLNTDDPQIKELDAPGVIRSFLRSADK